MCAPISASKCPSVRNRGKTGDEPAAEKMYDCFAGIARSALRDFAGRTGLSLVESLFSGGGNPNASPPAAQRVVEPPPPAQQTETRPPDPAPTPPQIKEQER